MVNRSKNIGTRSETAVVRAARAHGFPHAERRALRGRTDVGDVLLCPGVVAEVKGGQMARNASEADVERWLDETERERINAGAELAFLVVQRRGYGPERAGHWHAYWRHGWWARLIGYAGPVDPATVIRTSLASSLAALRANGWGDELEEVEPA